MPRGRPKLEEWEKAAWAWDVIVSIALAKADAAKRGEVLSDRATHARVVKNGGLIWLRGGGFPEGESQKGRKNRRCAYDRETGRLVFAKDGPLYLERHIQHAPSLKARYDKASQDYYRHDPNVRRVWDNMIAELTGGERQPPLFQTGGRQKTVEIRLADYLVPED